MEPLLALLSSVITAAVIWVLVGVPVAALISALRVFVWVIFGLPEMMLTAAVLGAAHGFWLYVVGRPSADQRELMWFGPLFGGVLGLLGFPPVVSRINSVVIDRVMVAVFLLAAVCAGIVAGYATAKVVIVPIRTPRSALTRSVIVGCLVVLSLAAIDYRYYWPEAADRLPVRQVSSEAIMHLTPGDALGSTWAGCYQYLGHFSRGSGGLGAEGGLLRVDQLDGSVKVQDGSADPLLGRTNGRGHFAFGAVRATGQDALRVLWAGQFKTDSLDFTRRLTLVRGATVMNTTRLTGTAQRISCDR